MRKSSIHDCLLSTQDSHTIWLRESRHFFSGFILAGRLGLETQETQTPVILSVGAGAGAGKVGRKAKDTRELYILWQLYCRAKKSFGTFSRYPLSFSLSFYAHVKLSTPSLRSTSFWSNPKKFPIYIVASGICCCSKNWNNQGCCVSVVFNSSWQCFRFSLKYKS